MRSAVVGPTTISPPCAEPAKRAATLVVGPVAVKVHRCPAPVPSLVAPTGASPVLIPMWSWIGGEGPPYSPLGGGVRRRTAKAARGAVCAGAGALRAGWRVALRPAPGGSLSSPS